jgi:hypothetical protein
MMVSASGSCLSTLWFWHLWRLSVPDMVGEGKFAFRAFGVTVYGVRISRVP